MAKLLTVADVAKVMGGVKKEAQDGLVETVGKGESSVVERFASILCSASRAEVMLEQLELDILTRAATGVDDPEMFEEIKARRKPRKKASKKTA